MFDHVKGGALRSRGIVALMASDGCGRRLDQTLARRRRRGGLSGIALQISASNFMRRSLAPTNDREPTDVSAISAKGLSLCSACRLSFWFSSQSLSKLAGRVLMTDIWDSM